MVARRVTMTRSSSHSRLRTYANPRIEPLASRLERAQRVEAARDETQVMMRSLHAADTRWQVLENVWVKGMCIPFFAFGTEWGFFLVWSMDGRWTPRQAAMVTPARKAIQAELGEEFPGEVEVIFHLPMAKTEWHRHVLIDEHGGTPIDLIVVGGRIDRVLRGWRPAGDIGLDPSWIDRLCSAGQPRWWLSGDGMGEPPTPPQIERF